MKLSLFPFLLLLSTSLVPITGFSLILKATTRNVALCEGTNTNDRMTMNKGSTCALITPFTESGRIDAPGLETLLQWHLDGGTDNLCSLGTTAEASVMDMQDRALVLKTVVEQVKGQITLLVGTGTINPESVNAMTQQAIDMVGADANLLVTPYYVKKPPQRSLVKHFTKIADMGLPVIMHNVPACNMLDETIAALAEHDNIIGIKDATGDLSCLQSVKAVMRRQNNNANNNDFLVCVCNDSTTKDLFCREEVTVAYLSRPILFHK